MYMGVSPYHASTIPLMLHLLTGAIMPQFHVVFDDRFSTTPAMTVPGFGPDDFDADTWEQLVASGLERSPVLDEGDPIPDLSDDWLTPEEISDRESSSSDDADDSDSGSAALRRAS